MKLSTDLILSSQVKYRFLFILLLFIAHAQTAHSQELDSLLNVLEQTMSKRAEFDDIKENRILNLKKLLHDEKNSLENNFYLINKIIDEYAYYSFDSTLFYIEKNLKIAEQIQKETFIDDINLKLGRFLISTGRYKESLDLLNEIHPNDLSEEMKKSYFENMMEVYSRLSFYTQVSKSRSQYLNLYETYKDSLISHIDKNSDTYLGIQEKELRDNSQLEKALEINSKRMSMAARYSRTYAIIAFERSLVYLINGNENERKKWLALSAISDITESIKDNASLTVLATLLFQENQLERAHNYINFSFEDAEFYNSQFRFINISNILPVISKAYEDNSLKQKSELKRMLIFISLLAIILLGLLFYTFKQNRKLQSARNKLKLANRSLKELNHKLSRSNEDLNNLYSELSEANRIKEHYIGTFLNLYSDYINKLDVYRKMVRKYIATNKYNALLDLTKSKQVIDSEMDIFFKNFDESFLHIYPKFIEQVNQLLEIDKQFQIKSEGILNTELRILALLRLGITSSSQIANILRYSVNTIYNYRVKIKNSAKNRDDFEDMIKNIQ